MAAQGFVDPDLFQQLQTKIDEDSELRQKIRDIVQELDKQQRKTTSVLSKVHSTSQADTAPILENVQVSLGEESGKITGLKEVASGHPYWKYNSSWTREIQTALFSLVMCNWLTDGRLITLENCGAFFKVPVNLKNEDAFHITIEEYLHALVNMTEELARLAVNAVTLGDYQRPLQISKFVKDLHAGFQLLNLKNDSLRRRTDSIKYNVKKIEDVVYDLSLRNLVPRGTAVA